MGCKIQKNKLDSLQLFSPCRAKPPELQHQQVQHQTIIQTSTVHWDSFASLNQSQQQSQYQVHLALDNIQQDQQNIGNQLQQGHEEFTRQHSTSLLVLGQM